MPANKPKTLTMADISQVVTMIPHRSGQLVDEVDEFTAKYALQDGLEAMAQNEGMKFRRDNHSIWVVRTKLGQSLAIFFSDKRTKVGTTVRFDSW